MVGGGFGFSVKMRTLTGYGYLHSADWSSECSITDGKDGTLEFLEKLLLELLNTHDIDLVGSKGNLIDMVDTLLDLLDFLVDIVCAAS